MKKNRGFTLVELLIVVAIVGIITSMAVPAFGQMMERKRLKEAIQAFHDDMQFARTRAVKESDVIFISRIQTSTTEGDWCYGLGTSACDCTTSSCSIKNISGADFDTIQMHSLSDSSFFNPRQGSIDAGGVTFYTTNYAARIVFSNVGRVRFCTPLVEGTGTLNRPTGTEGLPDVYDCSV